MAALQEPVEVRISEAPWNGDAGGYSDQQYESACALDRKVCGGDWASKPPKVRCSLPYKTPSGEVSRAGVHAAASRIGQVSNACPAAVAAAKARLRSAYRSLSEDAPDSLKAEVDQDGQSVLRDSWGVQEGEPRHGDVAIRAAEDADWELRSTEEDGFLATLHGHFAVFNRWTPIDSMWEGRFMERIAPGAFTKTFDENRDRMRCLFQHGRDPQIGMKPLGPIRELAQDDHGAFYEVSLLDTTYNRDLKPGLEAGQYGASFRFQVVREEVDSKPERSDFNPEGIEERTVTEARVKEFGPVTFGAYAEATSGIRSLNDQMWDLEMARTSDPERFSMFLSKLRGELPQARETEPEEPERPEESAPPPRAPDDLRAPHGRTTRLPGTKRALRTSRTIDGEPIWRIK